MSVVKKLQESAVQCENDMIHVMHKRKGKHKILGSRCVTWPWIH